MYHHNTQKKEISQLFEGVFEIWKEEGETLADLLIRFRISMGYSQEEKITYAGRLDPMASGVVILLVGQARFAKEEWNAKKKTYELDILLGVQTDTLDMLGIVENVSFIKKEERDINSALDQISCITMLPYPHYSSRPVEGKPLFVHARNGKEVKVPYKKVHIQKFVRSGIQERFLKDLIDEKKSSIQSVSGDFRQREILENWEVIRNDHGEKSVQIVSVCVTVSSGTYMRSLAQWVGKKLGVPALAYSIRRRSVEK